MASRLMNIMDLDLQTALMLFQKLALKHDYMVVEGIGGIMVPLTKNKTVADFVRLIRLPVLSYSPHCTRHNKSYFINPTTM